MSTSWRLSIFAFLLELKIGVCTINRKNVLIGVSNEHSSQRIIGQEVKLNDSRQTIAFSVDLTGRNQQRLCQEISTKIA